MIKHNLKKGYDIKLAGKTEKSIAEAEKPKLFASQPPDFIGLKPRLEVEIGSLVKIGSPLYYDKLRPEIKFVSPASGKVTQINRGDRRAICDIAGNELSIRAGLPILETAQQSANRYAD